MTDAHMPCQLGNDRSFDRLNQPHWHFYYWTGISAQRHPICEPGIAEFFHTVKPKKLAPPE
jgi:hypothetical protein